MPSKVIGFNTTDVRENVHVYLSAAKPRPRQPVRTPRMKHTSSTGTSQYRLHTRSHWTDGERSVREDSACISFVEA